MIWISLTALAVFISVYVALDKSHGSFVTQEKEDVLAQAISKLTFIRTLRERQYFLEKQRKCSKEAPQMFDVLTLGLSAGLSFDASLDLYLARIENTLSKELFQTQMMWRLGEKSRTEALEALAKQLDVAVIRRFSAAVSEALLFGVPLAATLVSQAKDIRQEQKAQVEEAIEKVPVKLLIPLGVLVVPAMLLAIMGPLLAGAFM